MRCIVFTNVYYAAFLRRCQRRLCYQCNVIKNANLEGIVTLVTDLLCPASHARIKSLEQSSLMSKMICVIFWMIMLCLGEILQKPPSPLFLHAVPRSVNTELYLLIRARRRQHRIGAVWISMSIFKYLYSDIPCADSQQNQEFASAHVKNLGLNDWGHPPLTVGNCDA